MAVSKPLTESPPGTRMCSPSSGVCRLFRGRVKGETSLKFSKNEMQRADKIVIFFKGASKEKNNNDYCLLVMVAKFALRMCKM